ncbi:MAG: 4-hydroxy-tetrahydrodipicolinate reductase [Deltaproteobacteria bacterium]|nr:4-hydroxy-tetrahydrodipicolinate reductase [Deltaproteobacteria bacterium]
MSPTLRLGVLGAGGKLGRLICAEASAQPGAWVVVPIPRVGALPAVDVVVDVSRPEGLAALLPRLDGQPLLVGTTGDLPWAALEAYASRAPVEVRANFSVGVPLLIELLRTAAAALPPGWDVEIVELHHNQKVDAPSGTALRLAAALDRPVAQHSLRAGDVIGEHTVYLCGPGERLELKHTATRREVFAIGALRAAAALVGRPPGLTRA